MIQNCFRLSLVALGSVALAFSALGQSPSPSPTASFPAVAVSEPVNIDNTRKSATYLPGRFPTQYQNTDFRNQVISIANAQQAFIEGEQDAVYRDYAATTIAFLDLLNRYGLARSYYQVSDVAALRKSWVEDYWPATDRLVADLIAQGRNPALEKELYQFNSTTRSFNLAGAGLSVPTWLRDLISPTSALATQQTSGNLRCTFMPVVHTCQNDITRSHFAYFKTIRCNDKPGFLANLSGAAPWSDLFDERYLDGQVCTSSGQVNPNLLVKSDNMTKIWNCNIHGSPVRRYMRYESLRGVGPTIIISHAGTDPYGPIPLCDKNLTQFSMNTNTTVCSNGVVGNFTTTDPNKSQSCVPVLDQQFTDFYMSLF